MSAGARSLLATCFALPWRAAQLIRMPRTVKGGMLVKRNNENLQRQL